MAASLRESGVHRTSTEGASSHHRSGKRTAEIDRRLESGPSVTLANIGSTEGAGCHAQLELSGNKDRGRGTTGHATMRALPYLEPTVLHLCSLRHVSVFTGAQPC